MSHRPDDGGSKNLWNVGKASTRLHSSTSQKTVIFILAAVRNWNLSWHYDYRTRRFNTDSTNFCIRTRILTQFITSHLHTMSPRSILMIFSHVYHDILNSSFPRIFKQTYVCIPCVRNVSEIPSPPQPSIFYYSNNTNWPVWIRSSWLCNIKLITYLILLRSAYIPEQYVLAFNVWV
jgi:hypothetical protein